MKTWLAHLGGRIGGSLWFMPVLMSLGAVVLLLVTFVLDDAVAAAAARHGYLYAGDVESARTVLATVAGSVINVAGVSFSVTMVALSLASSQFGPHLLSNFMRDRGNQVVLGGFIATFLFCLLALGTTTGDSSATASLTATIALVLASLSLMLLIYFIHHIATSMQADHVIREVGEHANRALDRLFPETAEPAVMEPAAGANAYPGRIDSARTGYIQAIDEQGLIRTASRYGIRLRTLHRPGHYVIEGAALVAANADPLPDEALAGRVQRAFIIGGHRTAEQDPEFAVHQLVEVALRALSPGINDPFTAITCVDRLTGLLCRIGPRAVRPALRQDADGTTRLEVDATDFAGMLDAAFQQIRQFAAGVPSVSIRLLEGLAAIAGTVHDGDRRAAVAHHGRMVMAAQQGRHLQEDQQALEQRAAALERALAGDSRADSRC